MLWFSTLFSLNQLHIAVMEISNSQHFPTVHPASSVRGFSGLYFLPQNPGPDSCWKSTPWNTALLKRLLFHSVKWRINDFLYNALILMQFGYSLTILSSKMSKFECWFLCGQKRGYLRRPCHFPKWPREGSAWPRMTPASLPKVYKLAFFRTYFITLENY